jgi:hypothetical protein
MNFKAKCTAINVQTLYIRLLFWAFLGFLYLLSVPAQAKDKAEYCRFNIKILSVNSAPSLLIEASKKQELKHQMGESKTGEVFLRPVNSIKEAISEVLSFQLSKTLGFDFSKSERFTTTMEKSLFHGFTTGGHGGF